MSVPYRTFVLVGSAVALLGAGYFFAPPPGAAALSAASLPKAIPVAAAATIAAPAPKPPSTLAANRAPVPMAPRTHSTHFAQKEAEASFQPASATTGLGGAGIDGRFPLAPGDATSGNSAQAKAAIELDGYKNVRGLEKGPDGIWRGRAMRGRTEVAIRVDAGGNVSAD